MENNNNYYYLLHKIVHKSLATFLKLMKHLKSWLCLMILLKSPEDANDSCRNI